MRLATKTTDGQTEEIYNKITTATHEANLSKMAKNQKHKRQENAY